MTFKINTGDQVPSFEGQDGEGKKISSKSLLGKTYVIYFYPKDDTPGCTKEACYFRDNMPHFDQLNIPVIGISPDTHESHLKFKTKYGLNFTLLSDPDHKICEAFDVWQEKDNFGKKYLGVLRSTFIIDEKGKISWIERPVQVEGHAERILQILRSY